MLNSLPEGRLIVGIGPVIAGWNEGQPVYYVDVLLEGGGCHRLMVPKRSAKADRRAKMEAVIERNRLAKELREHQPGGTVLVHDTASWGCLVALERHRLYSAGSGGGSATPRA